MGRKVREQKLFYHVTALENFENIFKFGLLSRKEVNEKKIKIRDIADQKIIEKRESLKILDYIPFHFFEKTAFTGAVYKKHSEICFCAIAITRKFAERNNFKICIAHPLSDNPPARIYSYNDGIKNLDWKKMEERNFNDERSKNVGMAECLVTSPLLPDDFFCIYVPNLKTKEYVESLARKILGNLRFSIYISDWCTQEGK